LTKQIKCPQQSHLLRRFWENATGFWGKRGTRLSWALSGALLLAILLNLAASYGMNVWTRGIFDALQEKDSHTILSLALLYLPLLAASVVFSVLQVYARMTTQRRWREWLTNQLVNRWFKNGRYHHLNLVSSGPGNPEYRVADDIRIATESPVDFVTGMISAVLSAATFIVILWTIGGTLTIHFSGMAITIPGFLVVAAMIYAVAASGSMVFIGRRFIAVSENKNQAEAEYRYVLTRLRENGESIALLQGEDEERNGADKSLKMVLRAWRDICIQTIRTTIVSQTSSYIAPVLPIILCAPKFLDGTMTLGEVMQAASAFTIVQAAFNWLVDNYPGLANWTASARRVALLQISVDELERAEIGRVGRINRCEGKGAALRLRNLSVTLDNRTLVTGPEVAIMPGEKVLVTGESGSGKSTLVRALAGLWPWGGGDIEMPAGAKLLLLPQRAYVPSGTLRRAANYPEAADSRSVEEVAKVLKKVGLGHLIEHLDEERPWDQILSGGEKQRLAFARIFLHRPDIIVLDEATAALDSQSEDRLMGLLSQEFKHATVVSVGHRPELEALHGRKIVLQRGRRGAKLVSDVCRIPKPVLPSERQSMGLLSLWNSSLVHRTFRQAKPASRM
jgi:vitamin B12/bleomycin/antimicrobial peptide transport system ATP-binding/permease protein